MIVRKAKAYKRSIELCVHHVQGQIFSVEKSAPGSAANFTKVTSAFYSYILVKGESLHYITNDNLSSK